MKQRGGFSRHDVEPLSPFIRTNIMPCRFFFAFANMHLGRITHSDIADMDITEHNAECSVLSLPRPLLQKCNDEKNAMPLLLQQKPPGPTSQPSSIIRYQRLAPCAADQKNVSSRRRGRGRRSRSSEFLLFVFPSKAYILVTSLPVGRTDFLQGGVSAATGPVPADEISGIGFLPCLIIVSRRIVI